MLTRADVDYATCGVHNGVIAIYLLVRSGLQLIMSLLRYNRAPDLVRGVSFVAQ